MAKSSIPNPMDRRHLIEKDLDPAKSLALAEAYLADGRGSEAVVFFAKAGADDRLRALADQAVESGDAFVLAAVAAVWKDTPGVERWLKLADAAEAAGKERYAEMARRHARSSEDRD